MKMSHVTFELFSEEMIQAPYGFYAALRRSSPVHYFASSDIWTVACRADVITALRRTDLFSSVGVASLEGTLLGADPPGHTPVRKIVGPAFSPAGVATLEDSIAHHVRELLPDAIGFRDWDLMANLARPFPMLVMADLLGLAATDAASLMAWADDEVMGESSHAPTVRQAIDRRKAWASEFFQAYADGLTRESARGTVGICFADGLVSGNLNRSQVADLAKLFVIAGSETTANLIGNATAVLVDHPELFRRIEADRALIPAFIEEALRYDTPAQNLLRRCTQPTDLGGVSIPQGALVMLLLGSANRDSAYFSDPDAFDVARKPADHLAFGLGTHFCLGARLARVEARIAFQELFSRLPNGATLSTPGRRIFRHSSRIRGLETFRLRLA
ncbi:MAG: cytochrome P450 [Acidobacteriota bacterium]